MPVFFDKYVVRPADSQLLWFCCFVRIITIFSLLQLSDMLSVLQRFPEIGSCQGLWDLSNLAQIFVCVSMS